MQQIANFIVDHDPMMVIRRTHDTVRYIRWEWNKEHADLIDEEELRLFLCDEHRGDLTEEQKVFARRCRDEMRSVYEEMCVRLCLYWFQCIRNSKDIQKRVIANSKDFVCLT